MESQPLVVVGAPRSGTTYLTAVLNAHPDVHLTNESRIFVLVKELISVQSKRPRLLLDPYQRPFSEWMQRTAGEWVESFYRDGLGVTARIWGDKYPHYADPCVLQYTDDTPRAAPAGAAPHPPAGDVADVMTSCLGDIRQILPHAKFIHIHRDPRRVVSSLVAKGWAPDVAAAAESWRRHVEDADGFLATLPDDHRLVVAHDDLRERPVTVIGELAALLGLHDTSAMVQFVREQERHPTPFSAPATDLSAPVEHGLTADEAAEILELAGPLARRWGYATTM